MSGTARGAVYFLSASLIFSLPRLPEEEASGPKPPVRLRVEYLSNPVGIDVKNPRFYWVPEHFERGQNQSAYQILVSTDPAVPSGEHWDSGKFVSDRSTHLVYAGEPLKSNTTYFWKVRWWDKDGNASPFSQVARFDTGLFSAEDWLGKWIGGYNQLRKTFHVHGKVARARAFVCGLGYYELRLNGRKVGDHVLDPGWTTYRKRVLYSSYDVTDLLHTGINSVGVILGRGWYGVTPGEVDRRDPPRLLLQMNIELEEGGFLSIVSDDTWKGTQGPILFDDVHDGEVYDARRETPGWDQAGFHETQWKPVKIMEEPGGVLSAQLMPPIKVVDTILPLEMGQPQAGVYVFDLGQNISGWVRLRVRGPRGTKVRLQHAEVLYGDGTINTENLRSARAEDVYILKGDPEGEIYEPRFTYHGFRYVELTGFPGVPTLDTLHAQVVHTAVEPTGSFSCSNPLLNRLQRNIVWTQKNNLQSIPLDCPQRDERMGWMGDAHLSAQQAMMNFDMPAFYTNFIRSIRDAQDEQGRIPDTVPHVWGQRPADPAWGAAYPLLCWYMYRHYGDTRILEENYQALKRYIDFLTSQAEGGLLKYSYYGDWVAIEKVPGEVVSSSYHYYSTHILSRVAEVLGNEADASYYRTLAAQIKKAFHEQYYNPKAKEYADGTQGAHVFPLFLDMVPESERRAVWGSLHNDIVYKHDTHLTTGIHGTKYLMELLTKANRADLAYDLVTQKTFPSWAYMIENGATTVWELWNEKEGPGMNSHNHPAFGAVGHWLYQTLAGVDVDEGGPGYKKIRIKPHLVRDLRYASGSVDTLRGQIVSSWKRFSSLKAAQLTVKIPVNSEAEVYLPTFSQWKNIVVKESGETVWQDQSYRPGLSGIKGAREMEEAIVVSIGSGDYIFEITGQ